MGRMYKTNEYDRSIRGHCRSDDALAEPVRTTSLPVVLQDDSHLPMSCLATVRRRTNKRQVGKTGVNYTVVHVRTHERTHDARTLNNEYKKHRRTTALEYLVNDLK